jgi:hypothetical protein
VFWLSGMRQRKAVVFQVDFLRLFLSSPTTLLGIAKCIVQDTACWGKTRPIRTTIVYVLAGG